MDRPPHDYSAAAAAMAFAQQQASNIQPQQQQLGFHHNHHYQQQQQQQQFPPPPFIPLYPSLQVYPFSRHIPPHHPPPIHLLHAHPLHHHQPPPPPAAAAHPPPPAPPQFWGPYDSAPPPAAPPPDPELQKRIEKLVEYAAKNGPEFESMIREKQRDNPAYGFLFGGEGSGYYYYKLWLSTRGGLGVGFSHPPPSPAMAPVIHPLPPPPPPPPPPTHFNAPPAAGLGGSTGPVGAGPSATPYMAPLYDQPQTQTMFENTRFFKGLSGPLPCDVALELNNVLSNLTGTKESIKGAKMWFMQRSPFAPALAEALRDRFLALEESERQLHIIYLANDILFDSLQRRANTQSLDNEALAFRPVLGPMLSRIYHNRRNREENQTRLQKILQFWGSKEVYDHTTISELESEMMRPPPPDPLSGPSGDPPFASSDLATPSGLSQHQIMPNGAAASNFEKKEGAIITTEDPQDNHTHFLRNPPEHSGSFPLPPAALEKAPAYPLFPPGLIPGMVRKMQIGSGVPYSPMSPLDIPTAIPPSAVPPSQVLDRVSNFFREVGEPNPSEGPIGPADGAGEDEGEIAPARARKGGACIPPPAALAVETEALAAATVYAEASPDPGPAKTLPEPTQYDDVYTSYRKQRSTSYHSSLGAPVRAAV